MDIHDQVEQLETWAKGKPRGPFSIEVHPTNRCNLNCLMCGTRINYRERQKGNTGFTQEQEKVREIPDDRLLRLVDEGAEFGVRQWLLSGGGEPFVRKQAVLEMMRRIKAGGMFGNLNTNGALLDKEDIRKIVDMKWDMIMFSVDGDQEVHDRIRQVPRTYDKAVRSMTWLKEMKARKKQFEPKLVFNSVLHNGNYLMLDKIIELGREVGVSDITFIPVVLLGDECREMELSESQKAEFQAKLPSYRKLVGKYDIDTNLDSLVEHAPEAATPPLPEEPGEATQEETKIPEPTFADTPCFEPFLHLVIKMDGSLSACCMLDSDENIKGRSLKEIWFGEYFETLRKALQNNELPDGCRTCILTQEVKNRELGDELRKLI